MTTPDPSIPPLSPRSAQAIRAMRQQMPSPVLRDRVRLALDAVSELPGRGRPHPTAAWPNWLMLAAPTVAVTLLAVHISLTRELPDRTSEVHVAVSPGEEYWTSLDLLLHHHDASHADVELHAPVGVRIEGADRSDCAADRCRHTLRVPTRGPSVRVSVSEPGDYHVEVSHASATRDLREQVTLRAR